MVPIPQIHFRFLKLPGEVRNMIYLELLASQHWDIRITGEKTPKGSWVPSDDTRRTPVSLYTPDKKHRQRPSLNTNILSVCRQINVEASTIFYSCNRFCFTNPVALNYFLMKIPSCRSYLRHICLTHLRNTSFGFRKAWGLGIRLNEAKDLQQMQLTFISAHLPEPEWVYLVLREILCASLARETKNGVDGFDQLIDIVMHRRCRLHDMGQIARNGLCSECIGVERNSDQDRDLMKTEVRRMADVRHPFIYRRR